MTVAELIAKPENWTKNAGARNKNGVSCGFDCESAICWCALGAMVKLYGVVGNHVGLHPLDVKHPLTEAVKKLAKVIGLDVKTITPYSDLAYWNDTHTHAEVIDAVIKAGI